MSGPLDGTRVLEFTQLIMGPQCCQLLRDLGCEVIKIEHPDTPDSSRRIPASEDKSAPPVYHANNRGKRSITIDFKKPEGLELVQALVADSDVLVTTLRPHALDRAGLGYEACRSINPRLIYAVGTTYGPEGPDSDRPGNDLMAQAAGGLAWNTGTPELAQGAGALVADTMGGMTLFGAIVTALFAREKSGVGQLVETSLLGGQIWAQSSELMAHVLAETQHERSQRTYPWLSSISPISIYQAKDGYVALSGVPIRWEDFWNALGQADLAANQILRAGPERLRQNDLITKTISEVFLNMTASDIHIILEEVGAVWAPVNDYDHVVTNPQVLESGYLRQASHPEYGDMVTMGTPVRYSDGIDEPADRAPELGENTEEILLELGYSWEQIESMKKSRAL